MHISNASWRGMPHGKGLHAQISIMSSTGKCFRLGALVKAWSALVYVSTTNSVLRVQSLIGFYQAVWKCSPDDCSIGKAALQVVTHKKRRLAQCLARKPCGIMLHADTNFHEFHDYEISTDN